MAMILLGFTAIALIDFIPLARRRKVMDIITFLVVFLIGLTLSVLINLGVKVPSLMNLWGNLIKWMGISYKS